MKLNYKTYSDLLLDIKRNIYKIPQGVDLIAGIPRSGMIPAYMLGLLLNVRVCSINELINGLTGSYGQTRFKPQKEKIDKIIIIDDSVAGGNAMRKVKIALANISLEAEIYFIAVYIQKGSEKFVDIGLCFLNQPRLFQWNYLNHPFLHFACLDIDGVLCADPTEDENDDGEKYRNFILNARPLYIPQFKVMALVTSRLEKYRELTEQWLQIHNVQYEKLFMLDLPSKEERLKQAGIHANFKASIYKNLKKSVLFLESNKEQAIRIAEAVKKAVFCVETDELIHNPSNFSSSMLSNRQKVKKILGLLLNVIPSAALREKIKILYRDTRAKKFL